MGNSYLLGFAHQFFAVSSEDILTPLVGKLHLAMEIFSKFGANASQPKFPSLTC